MLYAIELFQNPILVHFTKILFWLIFKFAAFFDGNLRQFSLLALLR
jgi:hypothetical protein